MEEMTYSGEMLNNWGQMTYYIPNNKHFEPKNEGLAKMIFLWKKVRFVQVPAVFGKIKDTSNLNYPVGGWTAHLKNMLGKLEIFPKVRGEIKKFETIT